MTSLSLLKIICVCQHVMKSSIVLKRRRKYILLMSKFEHEPRFFAHSGRRIRNSSEGLAHSRLVITSILLNEMRPMTIK